MDITLIIIWIITFIGWLLYKKVKRIYMELDAMGIPYEGAFNSYKVFLKIMTLRENYNYSILNQYHKFKNQQIIPSFSLSTRSFIIRDAAIIKQITIKDFDTFVNRDKNMNKDVDKFFGNMLFSLLDDEWRNMRNILSPIFTSSKMKMMFGILSDCASEFMNHYEEKIKKNGSLVINTKEVFSRFTVDGICSTVMGFKSDCTINDESELFKFITGIQKLAFWNNLKLLLFMVARKIYVLLKLQLTRKEVYDFFYNAIVVVMKEREEKGIFRPDVIQLLLQAKKGQLQQSDKEHDVNESELSNFSANIEYDVKAKNKKFMNWTDDHFMAQGFIFFAAGFDTTQILLQVTSFNLAKNKDVQRKLIAEVDEVIEHIGNSPVSYETLHKMKYLDMVISEALRYYPPAGVTTRECNRDYVLSLDDGKSIKMKIGDMMTIPIYAIHHDEKYFENPEKFDPERFSDERKGSIVDGSYIPFGSGPRICIGSRFALMEAKLIIFNILRKFEFDVCDKTPEKFELIPTFENFILKNPIYVEMKLRN